MKLFSFIFLFCCLTVYAQDKNPQKLKTPEEVYKISEDEKLDRIYFTDGGNLLHKARVDDLNKIYKNKAKTIRFKRNEITPVRLSYGYLTAIILDEEVDEIALGNSNIIHVSPSGKKIYLKPGVSSGNTNMHVAAGDRYYQFHVIIGNYTESDSKIVFNPKPKADSNFMLNRMRHTNNPELNDITMLKVVNNYDVLLRANKITEEQVGKFRVARKSPDTEFSYFNIYAFYEYGVIAIDFSYVNILSRDVRIDPRKVKILVGQKLLPISNLVWGKTTLSPNEKTNGIISIESKFLKDEHFNNFEIVIVR